MEVKMKEEIKKIENILKEISLIARESKSYWQGEAGEYHRAYLQQWYLEGMELTEKLRKETKVC